MHNPREKRGSKWSNPVSFERILVKIMRVWAHLSSFSSNPCSKAVQNDHIKAKPVGKNPKKNVEPREPGGISRRLSPVTTRGSPRMVEESRDASRLPKAGTVIQSLVHGQKESSPRFGVVY